MRTKLAGAKTIAHRNTYEFSCPFKKRAISFDTKLITYAQLRNDIENFFLQT